MCVCLQGKCIKLRLDAEKSFTSIAKLHLYDNIESYYVLQNNTYQVIFRIIFIKLGYLQH